MEFVQPGERRRRDDTDSNDRALNRRMFLMRGMAGVSFLALGGKLWHMEIGRGQAFQDIAEDNFLNFELLNAPRGRIVDRNGEPLAESRRAWTVSIVDSRLPADDDAREAVLQQLAQALDLKYVLALDRTLAPMGSETAIVNELAQRMPNQFDSDALVAKLLSPGATLALLKDGLSRDDAEALAASLADVPGVRALNTIDYELATHRPIDAPMIVKQDVDRDVALSIAANLVYLPGVVVDDNTLLRQYVGGTAFSHMLGYVGPVTEDEYNDAKNPDGTHVYQPTDVVGRGGVEQALESDLRGQRGGRWIAVDAQGVERYELRDQRKDPVPGLTAQLTIDKQFQQIVTDELQAGIKFADEDAQRKGREHVGSGVAIAIDPRSGELLAIVSLPTFDNQQFIGGISNELYDKYVNDPYEPLLDKSISGVFPPGSTVKPLLAGAALEEKIFGPDTANFKIDCKGSIRVPWTWDESQGNVYPCWVPEGHGQMDVFEGISNSCDVYFYNVGAPGDTPTDAPNAAPTHYYAPGDPQPHVFHGLGIDRIERYLREVYGFGALTGIELAGEAAGLVPNPKWLFQSDLHEYWSVGDTINVSIGQGHLLCTPLQLAVGTTRIANRGTLYQPRLIKALLREDGSVAKSFEPRQITPEMVSASNHQTLSTVSQEHLDQVREGMRRTALTGSTKGVITFSDPVVGTKSGTAEFGVAENGKYKRSHAWFTSFAPWDNPRICVAVLVVGGNEGSVYAGPIANKILDRYFHELKR